MGGDQPRPRAAVLAALLLTAAAAVPAAALCGRFPSPGFEADDAGRVQGRYRNVQYAYASTIPAGRAGYTSPSPAPDHGFGVVLSWEPRAYLYADGSHEVMDDKTVEAAAERSLGYTRQEASRMRSSQRQKSRLGSIQAIRQIARYECEGLAGIYVTDEFVALDREGGVVYTVSLSTVEKRYREDRRVLEAVARSFAVLPKPTFSQSR